MTPARRTLTPEQAMRRALQSGRRSAGRTFPNPNVGALIFRGARVLATGNTRPRSAGGAHAEVVAIERAIRRHGAAAVRGASMAVTLEPCAHTGNSGPCCDALIAAGIARLFVGIRDPHPLVSGRGLRKLRRAGIDVRAGVLDAECREHHRGFLSVCERGRPFVTLKLASTLDARIATAKGESRWITGEASRREVHRLRAAVDAVLIGSGTALADDPELTARSPERVLRRPVAVVVDSRLRVPAEGKLYSERAPGSGPWILCARAAGGARSSSVARAARSRQEAGAKLIEVARRGKHLDLRKAFRALAREGLTTLLVEGGGELAAALIRDRLVDELHWMLAPSLLGGDARAALGPLGISRLKEAPTLHNLSVVRRDGDLHLRARLNAWNLAP